jgi:hypothetical protein
MFFFEKKNQKTFANLASFSPESPQPKVSDVFAVFKESTSVLTYGDARAAFEACFGYDQKFDHGNYDAEWPAYVKQHPKLAALGM